MSIFDEAKIDCHNHLFDPQLVEQLFPDADVRRKILWEPPRKLFGFGPTPA